MRTRSKWLVSIISVSLVAVALDAAGPGYHVVATYKVGGDGGWDYLTADSDARRLYISRGTHVMVIDAEPSPMWVAIPGLLAVAVILLIYSAISARQTEINYGSE